jgi:hypothetical protein
MAVTLPTACWTIWISNAASAQNASAALRRIMRPQIEAERQTQAALPSSGLFESLSLSARDLIKIIVVLFKSA